MKIKLLSCFLLIILVVSCNNSNRKLNINNTGKAGSNNARTIKLTDNNVRSYINVAHALYKSNPELLEKVQAQVPVDISGNTGLITNSGFKDLNEFNNTSLVISICMNTIIQGEHLDDIQGMTKEDYKNQFLEGLDDEDEFDKLFREQAEKQMDETLSELESEGLIGQNTNTTATFLRLLKEKVGESNTELVIRHFDELKSIWMYTY